MSIVWGTMNTYRIRCRVTAVLEVDVLAETSHEAHRLVEVGDLNVITSVAAPFVDLETRKVIPNAFRVLKATERQPVEIYSVRYEPGAAILRIRSGAKSRVTGTPDASAGVSREPSDGHE